MPNRLDLEDLPVDPEEVCEEAGNFFYNDEEKSGNAFLILAQLDPMTLGEDGAPLYTAAQQTLIVEASAQVAAWRAS